MMKGRSFILISILLGLLRLGPAHAAEEKSILEVLPGLAELGKEWTTNLVTYLFDPCSQPSEIAFGEDPKTSRFLNWLRTSLQGDHTTGNCLAGRTGYCLVHYGCGDFMFNSGENQICIMRWRSRTLLHNAWVDWKMNWCRVVRDVPPVGEDSYWIEDLTSQKLTFRRGLFTVAITAGLRSDYRPMLRLAQAIDAKICGHPVPKQAPAAVDQGG